MRLIRGFWPLAFPYDIVQAQMAQANPVVEALPILRWAGSKRKLLPTIAQHFPTRFDRYVEPFAGSACVFVKLNPSRSIINDINAELIRTYRVIKSKAEQIATVLESWPRSRDLFYLLRYIRGADLDVASRAARFIYLNRYSFNGVYRTNEAGTYNVPMGTKTGKLPTGEELSRFADRLSGCSLYCLDSEEIVSMGANGDFFYLNYPIRNLVPASAANTVMAAFRRTTRIAWSFASEGHTTRCASPVVLYPRDRASPSSVKSPCTFHSSAVLAASATEERTFPRY